MNEVASHEGKQASTSVPCDLSHIALLNIGYTVL